MVVAQGGKRSSMSPTIKQSIDQEIPVNQSPEVELGVFISVLLSRIADSGCCYGVNFHWSQSPSFRELTSVSSKCTVTIHSKGQDVPVARRL